jgi:phosphate transport system permease protein
MTPVTADAAPLAARLGRGRRADLFRWVTGAPAWAAPAVLLVIVAILLRASAPAIAHNGLAFLAQQVWDPVRENFGALAFVYGTIVSSAIALLLAVPVGVGAAIFLAEPGLPRVRAAVGIGVELLAAIPSVVYGIWGLFVVAPFLLTRIEIPISARLSRISIFGGFPSRQSMLAAGVVLAIMVLPTMAAVSRDVIRAIPWDMREASTALGATWWETTWRAVLPAARGGIVGAGTLALGRALGETIAVTMVIGNRPEISASLFAPGYSLASVIANEFTEATGRIYPAVLMELGLVLMAVTLVVNLGAVSLVRATTRNAS